MPRTATALALGVDLVAMSFVQTAGDVEAGLAIMRGAGRTVPLIAKIERPRRSTTSTRSFRWRAV